MSDYWELQFIEVRSPEDTVKSDDELWCGKCETLICDIEAGDTLDTLARTAMDHTCSPGRCACYVLSPTGVCRRCGAEWRLAEKTS